MSTNGVYFKVYLHWENWPALCVSVLSSGSSLIVRSSLHVVRSSFRVALEFSWLALTSERCTARLYLCTAPNFTFLHVTTSKMDGTKSGCSGLLTGLPAYKMEQFYELTRNTLSYRLYVWMICLHLSTQISNGSIHDNQIKYILLYL